MESSVKAKVFKQTDGTWAAVARCGEEWERVVGYPNSWEMAVEVALNPTYWKKFLLRIGPQGMSANETPFDKTQLPFDKLPDLPDIPSVTCPARQPGAGPHSLAAALLNWLKKRTSSFRRI